MPRPLTGRYLLTLALLFVGLYAGWRWQDRHQFADGCDAFGYLRLAQVLERAWEQKSLPNFRIETPQHAELVAALKKKNFAPMEWSHFVAPHAHHYNPASNSVGIQYPPGTGLLLALFDPKTSVTRMSQLALVLLAMTALLSLWRAPRETPIERLVPIAFAAFSSMVLVDTVQHYSYSVQAALPFLALGTLLLVRCRTSSERSEGPLLVAAASLALASLCRIPIIFHAPAWFFMLRPSQRFRFTALYCIFFLVPLGFYNHHLTGAFWKMTYSSIDHAPPSLGALATTIPYYLWGGGTQYLWAVALQCLWIWPLRRALRPWAPALGLLVAVPLAYFLLHQIHWSYYLHPTWVSLVWALGGIAMYETRATDSTTIPTWRRHAPLLLATIGALLLTLVAFRGTRIKGSPPPLKWGQSVSEASRRDDVWILSDIMSGSFWFYLEKGAFRPNFASPAVADWFVSWVTERGETLWIVEDSSDMSRFLQRQRDAGLSFTRIDRAFGYPVWAPCDPPSVCR